MLNDSKVKNVLAFPVSTFTLMPVSHYMVINRQCGYLRVRIVAKAESSPVQPGAPFPRMSFYFYRKGFEMQF